MMSALARLKGVVQLFSCTPVHVRVCVCECVFQIAGFPQFGRGWSSTGTIKCRKSTAKATCKTIELTPSPNAQSCMHHTRCCCSSPDPFLSAFRASRPRKNAARSSHREVQSPSTILFSFPAPLPLSGFNSKRSQATRCNVGSYTKGGTQSEEFSRRSTLRLDSRNVSGLSLHGIHLGLHLPQDCRLSTRLPSMLESSKCWELGAR